MSPLEARLSQLRQILQTRKLDGFLVPRGDMFRGEEVQPQSERLAWISSFAGSAGIACVLMRKAALFVDGRYLLEARKNIPGMLFEVCSTEQTTPTQWLLENLAPGDVLGFDPWLHTHQELRNWQEALHERNIRIRSVHPNPIDEIWKDRPQGTCSNAFSLPLSVSGVSSAEKLFRVFEKIRKQEASAALLTAPDAICWLLNVRGRDLPCSPILLCFAILDVRRGVTVFAQSARMPAVGDEGISVPVRVEPMHAFPEALRALEKGKRILVDPKTTPLEARRILHTAGVCLIESEDPCRSSMLRKNEAELAGFRRALVRDSALLVKLLVWLEQELPRGELREHHVDEKLESLRATQDKFICPSFPTIVASGPNAALPHYRFGVGRGRRLCADEVLLVDCGAHYRDGTTDTTRTVVVGTPAEQVRKDFTQVLKGHIALAVARFPQGTCGRQLDVLARAPMWQEGMDYAHGTGHGVGSVLRVHEPGLAMAKKGTDRPMESGMVLSNEPAVYRCGSHGIRTENLIAVQESGKLDDMCPMLQFETLTLAPMDRKLILFGSLLASERAWLCAYHHRVRETLSPLLEEHERVWLREATASLS